VNPRSPTDVLLAEHSEALYEGLRAILPDWAAELVRRLGSGHADESAIDAGARRLRDYATGAVLDQVKVLLETDIDAQWTSPLEVVRLVVGPATDELQALGAPPVPRDAQSAELHPDDIYDLTPSAFAEIHPSLHQLGLAWGAAKAHVHLRRHRPAPAESPPVVVVFAPDLGDRSRFDAYDVTHVRSAGMLAEVALNHEPDLVIVDLDRAPDPAAFRVDNAHVVGFGSHVATDRQEMAQDAGYDAVMARSVFFHRLPELLAPVSRGSE
jgi:hypothetical protein